MAESSLTTPGAVSRRFLFSIATAAPIAAATAGFPGVSAPSSLHGLLDRYRDTGMRLREAVRRDPENREELKREHMVRIDAWLTRRNHQKDWYRRTGLDVIIQQRHHLLAEKHRIERELMTLMIGPDKAAIEA